MAAVSDHVVSVATSVTCAAALQPAREAVDLVLSDRDEQVLPCGETRAASAHQARHLWEQRRSAGAGGGPRSTAEKERPCRVGGFSVLVYRTTDRRSRTARPASVQAETLCRH